MAEETADVQDPNKNDIIYESELVKVEYDKTCWGPNRWIVFSRPDLKTRWRIIAECPNSEAAMKVADDPDRLESGDLARTEVERLQKRRRD